MAFWMRFCIKNTFLSAIWRHFLHKTSSNPQNFPPAAGRNFFKPRNLKNFKTQCFSCSQDIGFSCSQLCLRICRGRARTPADQILDYVRPYTHDRSWLRSRKDGTKVWSIRLSKNSGNAIEWLPLQVNSGHHGVKLIFLQTHKKFTPCPQRDDREHFLSSVCSEFLIWSSGE